MPIPFCFDSCSPRRRIFSSPFKATWTIFESITVRRSQRGFVQPSATKYLYNIKKKQRKWKRRTDNPAHLFWHTSLLLLILIFAKKSGWNNKISKTCNNTKRNLAQSEINIKTYPNKNINMYIPNWSVKSVVFLTSFHLWSSGGFNWI